jgi:secondary thiamine-phosphate synthase enzyme
LRRSRERSRDLLPHGLSPASHDGSYIVARVVVIKRSQSVEIAGVERLEPPADEIERIGGHALEYFTCMKAQTKYLTLNIPSRMAFRNITPEVDEAVRSSGVQEGLVLVNTMHITSSVFINDDERGLHHDFGRWLEQLAPFNPDPDHYHHNRTGEDNADAHLKRQVMGREVVVAITKGKLDFGPWEQIFYGEFDGNRNKRVLIKVIGE